MMDFKELEYNIEKIKDLYLNQNITSTKLAEMFGCKKYQINYLLTKYKIQKSISEAKRVYFLNEHYFDEIDTPNKAYVLGFLYADGYNSRLNNTIRLSLNYKDKDILERMRIEIGCEKPLSETKRIDSYDGKERHMVTLTLASKYMCNTVEKWGLTQAKTFTINFPDFLPEELIPHFIRGYFDGDGCACVCMNGKYKRLFITMMSSSQFCYGMQKYLKTQNIFFHVNQPSGKSEKNKIIRSGNKNETKKFIDLIYKDADLYMQRKYDKSKSYFEQTN